MIDWDQRVHDRCDTHKLEMKGLTQMEQRKAERLLLQQRGSFFGLLTANQILQQIWFPAEEVHAGLKGLRIVNYEETYSSPAQIEVLLNPESHLLAQVMVSEFHFEAQFSILKNNWMAFYSLRQNSFDSNCLLQRTTQLLNKIFIILTTYVPKLKAPEAQFLLYLLHITIRFQIPENKNEQ